MLVARPHRSTELAVCLCAGVGAVLVARPRRSAELAVCLSVQVSELCSWHARAALLSYVQLAVFCNLFLLQSSDDVVQQLRQLVLRLLSDDQLEVSWVSHL